MEIRMWPGMMEDYPFPYADISYEKVGCPEHVKLSVEHADARNEYASGDKLGLNLPGLQEELLETVAAMGKPVVVLLMAGSAIDLPWAEHNPNVKAIVDCWYPGARGGKVIAEILFGEFSPSGKLPVRFYHGTENLPVWNIRDDYERREDIPAGSSGAGSGTAL